MLADSNALASWLEEHNAGLAAARARVAEASADLGSAGLAPNPEVEFDWGGINVGAHVPAGLASGDSQNYQFGLRERVELGKRGPRVEAARWRLEAERERYRAELADRVADARAALGRVVYLAGRVDLLQESFASAQQALDVESARRAHGDVSDNDFDRLALDTTLLELDLPKSRSDLESARADLRTILGARELGAAAGADALAALPSVDLGVDLGVDALEDALQRRSDVRAADDELEAAKADERLAHRQSIPDPTIGVAYEHDRLTVAGNQPDTLALSVGFDLPLCDRGQHAAEHAHQTELELAHQREETLREARAEAQSLLERQRSLADVLARLQRDAIPKSSQVLEATRGAFDRGELSLTEVLLARRTHTDLVLKQMDLEFESFSARNDLRRVLELDRGSEVAHDRDRKP